MRKRPCAIRVIESHIVRGTGQDDDPWRDVIQYHTFSGEFLAEKDEFFERVVKDALRKFVCHECKGEFSSAEYLNKHLSQSAHEQVG